MPCPFLLGLRSMIRLLPKIMMLASSAVLSSVPSATPADWFKEVSDRNQVGYSFGIATDFLPSHIDVGSLMLHSDAMGMTLVADFDKGVYEGGYNWCYTKVWFNDDFHTGLGETLQQVLSGLAYGYSIGFGIDISGYIRYWDGNFEYDSGNISVNLYEHFLYDGTISIVFDPGQDPVDAPRVVGFDSVPLFIGDDTIELEWLPFYQADYSESASDVFGVVTDAIGEMGSGLADGVGEATALFYADGSFTTLGILTLLTCGVALVFWAFYLIRKYLHVGVK